MYCHKTGDIQVMNLQAHNLVQILYIVRRMSYYMLNAIYLTLDQAYYIFCLDFDNFFTYYVRYNVVPQDLFP